jgi:hypothetical protein
MAVLPMASPPCYASGSEEKVIRILEAPQAFEDTLVLSRGEELHNNSSTTQNQVILGTGTPVNFIC